MATQFPALSCANVGDTFDVRDILYPMTSAGRGTARGIELFAEKTFDGNWFGQFNLTYSRARHAGLDRELSPGAFDRPFVFNLVGGRRIATNWELAGPILPGRSAFHALPGESIGGPAAGHFRPRAGECAAVRPVLHSRLAAGSDVPDRRTSRSVLRWPPERDWAQAPDGGVLESNHQPLWIRIWLAQIPYVRFGMVILSRERTIPKGRDAVASPQRSIQR